MHTYAVENDPIAGRCIVMEYIDGRTLSQFLNEKPTKSRRKRVLLQLLNAMEYYHAKQITHRDLKPSNILITANGDNVKLIDFGLADTDDSAVLKGPAYTKAYAAPEQLKEGMSVDCRTDIYAFGVLLRQIFPHRYGSIARGCTRYKPEDRYQTAADICNAIERYDTVRKILPIVAVVFVATVTTLLLLLGRHYTTAIDSPSEPYDTTQTIQTSPTNPIAPTTPSTPSTSTVPSHHATTSMQTSIDNAKPIMNHYADSLYTLWQARIDDGTYDTYAKANISRSYMQNLILERLYHLLPTMHEKNDAEWHQCWYALYEPMKTFTNKTDNYLSEKNLPEPYGQYGSPEVKVLNDSLTVSAKRLGILIEAENRNRWKRYK